MSDRITLWVQCFEYDALARVREATGLAVFLLLDADADWRAVLSRHAHGIDGLGVDKRLLRGSDGAASGVVDAAHALGLAVHAWTYRDDVLPAGVAEVQDELHDAFDQGVDAVFCDFPATAVALRDIPI